MVVFAQVPLHLQRGKGRQEQGSRVDKEDKERQGEDIMVDKDIRFFEKMAKIHFMVLTLLKFQNAN